MLRCTIDINGKLLAAITIVKKHRMAKCKEVEEYDYTIIQKLPDDEQRIFVGELSHILANGALVLLKEVLDQESWLVVEKNEEDLDSDL